MDLHPTRAYLSGMTPFRIMMAVCVLLALAIVLAIIFF
jgi:hypothetical protein